MFTKKLRSKRRKNLAGRVANMKKLRARVRVQYPNPHPEYGKYGSHGCTFHYIQRPTAVVQSDGSVSYPSIPAARAMLTIVATWVIHFLNDVRTAMVSYTVQGWGMHFLAISSLGHGRTHNHSQPAWRVPGTVHEHRKTPGYSISGAAADQKKLSVT
jgi:hypothetical protein